MPKRLMSLALGLAGLVIALLALAWYDGGREDLREITVPLALPESVA